MLFHFLLFVRLWSHYVSAIWYCQLGCWDLIWLERSAPMVSSYRNKGVCISIRLLSVQNCSAIGVVPFTIQKCFRQWRWYICMSSLHRVALCFLFVFLQEEFKYRTSTVARILKTKRQGNLDYQMKVTLKVHVHYLVTLLNLVS